MCAILALFGTRDDEGVQVGLHRLWQWPEPLPVGVQAYSQVEALEVWLHTVGMTSSPESMVESGVRTLAVVLWISGSWFRSE